MEHFLQTPEWFGAAVVGAIIASLGYLAKVLIELGQQSLQRTRTKRASLIQLRSLLRATKVAFKIQNANARKLVESIRSNVEDQTDKGLEMAISNSFADMDRDQKELHSIIRGVTIFALCPTNRSILDWLKADTYYKARHDELAEKLSVLEAHIILWLAKYESWIPSTPEHALVYLDDEKKHGLGFPPRLDELVDRLTGYKWKEEEQSTEARQTEPNNQEKS